MCGAVSTHPHLDSTNNAIINTHARWQSAWKTHHRHVQHENTMPKALMGGAHAMPGGVDWNKHNVMCGAVNTPPHIDSTNNANIGTHARWQSVWNTHHRHVQHENTMTTALMNGAHAHAR